jgi:uncharacterized protein (UPF0248 family)
MSEKITGLKRENETLTEDIDGATEVARGSLWDLKVNGAAEFKLVCKQFVNDVNKNPDELREFAKRCPMKYHKGSTWFHLWAAFLVGLAAQTVLGRQRLEEYIKALGPEMRSRLKHPMDSVQGWFEVSVDDDEKIDKGESEEGTRHFVAENTLTAKDDMTLYEDDVIPCHRMMYFVLMLILLENLVVDDPIKGLYKDFVALALVQEIFQYVDQDEENWEESDMPLDVFNHLLSQVDLKDEEPKAVEAATVA